MAADTSHVKNSCIQLEPQCLPEGADNVVPSKIGTTLKSSLPSSAGSLRHQDESSRDLLRADKPMIHLLGGSYELDLNLGKISRKIAKKEEKERRKLSVRLCNKPRK